jgi:cytochrome c553
MPSLAAQPDLFIQWQLVFFRAGTRKNEQMQPIVEQLNNEDIRNLGAYYASLPPPKAPKPDDDPDLSKKGAQAAVGRRCASCHTDTYAGTKAVARVAGQREEYLVKALQDYKSGVRAGGAMAAMADVAYPLSEEEIEALAHYLAHLSRRPALVRKPARGRHDRDRVGRLRGALLLIRLEMRVGDAQLRHRYLRRVGAGDEIADHMVGLDRQSRPDVAEHRCRQG